MNFARPAWPQSSLKMPLFDFCFNFTNAAFRTDEAQVLQRAHDAGVGHFLVTGSDQQDSRHALELAETYPQGMYVTAGVHPHLAKNWQGDTRRVLKQLAQSKRVKAIGEGGLDYYRNFSSPAQQEHAFRQQIELAVELQMPLFLHEREAHQAFYGILKDYKNDLGPAVVHCFTGDARALENYLRMDLYIGITGWICDERRGAHLHDLVAVIPQDRLLIETDAPYLLPRTLRPKPEKNRNEPMHLAHIAAAVALHRGDSLEKLGRYTTHNALRFLGLLENQDSPE